MTELGHYKILIVEDDEKISSLVSDALRAAGYKTQIEIDGHRAIELVKSAPPSLIILDLCLPGLDGLEICRNISLISDVPILMVTALVDEEDRIRGLESGASDYICKPFSVRELIARVGANIRRREKETYAANPYWPFLISDDEANFTLPATIGVRFTSLEMKLLIKFIKQPNRIFNRAQLLDLIYTDFRDVTDRSIDGHIKNIRKKLSQLAFETSQQPIKISTVYGLGYRYDK